MHTCTVVEVCVQSIDHALAAERGGAHRIEFCADLFCGGITPPPGLIETVRSQLQIPIHVLIRPRAGDFVYSDEEFETMKREIRSAKAAHADGVVLGVLDQHGRIDVARTGQLVELARPLPVTFHRAFDSCPDPLSSLEAVTQSGARRILSSGCQGRAVEGLASLSGLVRAAGSRVIVMPGGGITVDNVAKIVGQTGAREIHSALGGSSQRFDSGDDSDEFEDRVRALVSRARVRQPDITPCS